MSIFNSYQEYMQSELWRTKRKRILARDNYRCQKCGSAINLRVHHIRYPDVYGAEPDDDLVTLCDSCHQEVHKKDLMVKEQRSAEKQRSAAKRKKYFEETVKWANQTKYRDFVYGGPENMCELQLLKNSADAYSKEHNCDTPGVSYLQTALAYAHTIVVKLLLNHGYTEGDIYLMTPLPRQTVSKYVSKELRWVSEHSALSKNDLDGAASEYVNSILTNDRRQNENSI